MNLLNQKVTHITKGECYPIIPTAGDGLTVREIVTLPISKAGYGTFGGKVKYRGLVWGYIHAFFINGDFEGGRYDAYNDAEMFKKLLAEETG